MKTIFSETVQDGFDIALGTVSVEIKNFPSWDEEGTREAFETIIKSIGSKAVQRKPDFEQYKIDGTPDYSFNPAKQNPPQADMLGPRFHAVTDGQLKFINDLIRSIGDDDQVVKDLKFKFELEDFATLPFEDAKDVIEALKKRKAEKLKRKS